MCTQTAGGTSIRAMLRDRPVLAWALYDWANSAFATTVMAAFFPVFYAHLSSGLSTEDAQFWFTIGLSVASLLIALAAPILGAIADHGGTRKHFLATFTMLGAIMTMSLAWVHGEMWREGLLLFLLAQIGFAGANIFYDPMILEISREEEYDQVSGFGYACGYMGGGLLFLVNVIMVTHPDWFGLADASSALAWSFISVGVWWVVFSVPLFIWVREHPTPNPVRSWQVIRAGLLQLRETFSQIRQLRVVLIFLVSYWLYIDGVGSVIKMSVFFANRVLELPSEALIGALLLTQFISFPAVLFFGWLGNRIGAKISILIGLLVYIWAVVYAWGWLDSSRDFYLLAVAIGLVQGGVQGLSRSIYARIIPPNRTAEFFGFYNMVGKFAAILGPLLIAMVPVLIVVADARDAILVLVILFVAGGILLTRVDVVAGAEAARNLAQGSSRVLSNE